jgi:leucyl-tRNA synthetase
MEYNFRDIEKRWQKWWKENKVYQVSNESSKPKYYALDMFPYPSGAGLHVGHPLGYIASDIYARFKRLKGFNVLHPMGYDAFGLPAEQYAIEHGIHPAASTENNINNFRKQLDNIGFSFDWSREVRTSDPKFYKWTQWIFLQLFDCWYNRKKRKAERISKLIAIFEKEGNRDHPVPDAKFEIRNPDFEILGGNFSADQWKAFGEKTRHDILMEYRLAYCGYGEVNWCEALGTVLANDEVINGVSERGGYPVVKKKLRQWYLRITEYADRLLEGLLAVDFSESMKEMQTNWIGKSEGAEITFGIKAPSRPSPEGKESQPTEPRYRTAQPSLYHLTKKLADEKRKNPTHEEMMTWERLKNNQTGFHVRRQHIIGSFIVDFACLDKLATIEIDGGYHKDLEIKKYDEARTRFLKANGFTELRYTNDEVREDIEAVIKDVVERLKRLPSVPSKREHKQVLPLGEDLGGASIRIYTTRPDTIFGVDFIVIAPEHELVEQITTAEQKPAVEEYITYVKSRSERERMAEKKISGVFTGAYCIHPFSGKEIPVWISEYVLIGYGTGAIMAVPCGDERDHKFANHFGLEITNIIGSHYNGEEANPTKDAVLENSDFLNGMVMKDAISVVVKKVEELGIGERRVNYKMRDAAFSRQRYWGEPFPIVWKNGMAYPLDEKELPLELPHVESYKPGPEGEGPLANIPEWIYQYSSPAGAGREGALETNTMPGYAGSSWYFLRYMDPHNEKEFCNRKYSNYWGQVDLYIGGTEHAVGHLLYSRMWTKFLYDMDLIGHDEPYKRLVNQGMIQGSSRFVYRAISTSKSGTSSFSFPIFFSSKFYEKYLEYGYLSKETLEDFLNDRYSGDWKKPMDEKLSATFSMAPTHVDVNIVDGTELNIEEFKKWRNGEYGDAKFILEDGSLYQNGSASKYICGVEVEKMSKSKFNVVNPDDLVVKYGADTFRMYEMFLGPVEMSKPWDTKGIEGVHRFLKKFWRLFYKESNSPSTGGGQGEALIITDETATNEELKVLHKTIKKIEEDTERFSFNTGVSAFMIATNELTDLKCHKRSILEPLVILLAPYAPHIAEELWHLLGQATSVVDASYPAFEEKYLKESSKTYPVAINGKTRTELTIALDATQQQVEEIVLANEVVKKWMEGKSPKKVIYVKNKMVNVVV